MGLEAAATTLGAPTPRPIEVVIENSVPGAGLTAWLPLIAALLTLAGVVYASHRTGKNMIKAEDRRAEAAIEAERERARLAEKSEDKRASATIEAENRRARAAIEAENLRHENELRRATRDHLLDTVRETYTALESGRRALHDLAFILEPVEDPGLQVYLTSIESRMEEWQSARAEYSRVLDSVTLIGSDTVSNLALQVDSAAFMLDLTLGVAKDEMQVASVNASIEGIRAEAGRLRVACSRLLAGMRAELHPTAPTQSPAQ